MKKLTRILPIALFGLVFLTSCEETSLIPADQQNRDNRNIQAYLLNYWGGSAFAMDSVYEINGGSMKIDNIRIVFSDYEFSLSTGDTVDVDTSYTVASIGTQIHKVGLLPAGVYNGEHQLKVGYDSATYFGLPYPLAPDNLLADGIRRANVGYNHLVITGKYRLEDDTINLVPHLPFEYRLGGMEFMKQFEVPMNFAVTANNPVSLIFNLNVDQLFMNDINPVVIEQIMSDPNDNADYTAAETLFSNLDQALSVQ